MIAEKAAKDSNKFYILMFSSLAFIAILICSGLFIKAEYGHGTKPPPVAAPKAAAEIAGRYVGYTTIQTGICSIGAHELVIDIDGDGAAKSNYGMKSSRSLTGRANPDGKLKLGFRENDLTIRFEGEVHQGHITGHSFVSDDHTCDIYWDLQRA
ncbi:MAG TPA: hypothetical protein VKQ29_06900 [Aliidongia sp.]|nr:hypothetical protein [Aliidongia sp.]